MNIFGFGPLELLLIVVLALIVFGPEKLPEIMAQVGRAINDFRRATSSLSDEFNRTIQAELQETRSVVADTKAIVADAQASLSGLPAPVRTAVPAEATLPATFGVGTEPHTDLTTTNGTNGSAAVVTPPLANTAQWSWETSAPPSSTPGSSTATPNESEAAPAPSSSTEPNGSQPNAPSVGESTAVTSTQPEAHAAPPRDPEPPRSARKPALRDELLPPY